MTILRTISCAVAIGLAVVSSRGEDVFEQDPINYSAAVPDDTISRLAAAIEDGQVAIEHEPGHGYLKALLDELA